MKHKVDIGKLVHLIKHNSCEGMNCVGHHGIEDTVCPMFETMCQKKFQTVTKARIAKAMKAHNIVQGDLVAHMIGNENDGEQ